MAKEKMITRVVSISTVKVTWYDEKNESLFRDTYTIPEFESMKKPDQYIASTYREPGFTYVKHDIIETEDVKYSLPLRLLCVYGTREYND